jgi:probable rRNA maturation factor
LDSADRELSLLLTDDAEIRALNRRWRRLDRATDVLSFPMAGRLLGDVVISAETAARRAGPRLDRELAFLMVHGVLHLLGHDHRKAAERRRMRARERALVRLVERERKRRPYGVSSHRSPSPSPSPSD